MKKLWIIAALVLATAPALAQSAASAPAQAVVATKGAMLNSADGSRLGPVYRVNDDGSAQIIIDGKLTTSLKKAEVISLQ